MQRSLTSPALGQAVRGPAPPRHLRVRRPPRRLIYVHVHADPHADPGTTSASTSCSYPFPNPILRPSSDVVPKSCRKTLSRLAGTVAGLTVFLAHATHPAPAWSANTPHDSPYLLAGAIPTGLEPGAHMRSCPTNINPNCISTSSLSGDNYGSPWRVPEGFTLEDATAAIVRELNTISKVRSHRGSNVLRRPIYRSMDTRDQSYACYLFVCLFVRSFVCLQGEAILESSESTDAYRYVYLTVPSVWGRDKVEVVVKKVGGTGGSTTPEQLVFYRSIAGGVKYIWPITQPVGDNDANVRRPPSLRPTVDQIRSDLTSGASDLNPLPSSHSPSFVSLFSRSGSG
jgi:hypothetical protein